MIGSDKYLVGVSDCLDKIYVGVEESATHFILNSLAKPLRIYIYSGDLDHNDDEVSEALLSWGGDFCLGN